MNDTAKTPRAPKGLGTRGRALWRDLHREFDMTRDPHRMVLVEDACRTADLIDRLQESVDAQDLRVRGSQGQPVAAPELAEIRQHRGTLAMLLGKLALPDTEEMQELKKQHVTEVRRQAAFKSVEARNGR
ncbi:hypothetical protein [Rhodococcus zopfii]|uniref:hypothetical protein n=1 Tax=Rhodococcus zopfii TaxID=43772 RepID=UPI0011112F4D|nr:hypothetical protein [Rhodococcus zopfii]